MSAVANFAVTMSMHVESGFYRYTSGIYQNPRCTSLPGGGHAVTIVGYSYDARTNSGYWRVRNTWGSGWGDKGYFNIRMDTTPYGPGECNMYLRGSFVQW